MPNAYSYQHYPLKISIVPLSIQILLLHPIDLSTVGQVRRISIVYPYVCTIEYTNPTYLFCPIVHCGTGKIPLHILMYH